MELNVFYTRSGYSNQSQNSTIYLRTVSDDFGVSAVPYSNWVTVGSITCSKIGSRYGGGELWEWQIPIRLLANSTGEARSTTILCMLEDTPQEVRIWQASSSSTASKVCTLGDDATVDIPTSYGSGVEFEVWRMSSGREAIFQGTARCIPQQSTVHLKVNQFVMDYLDADMDLRDDGANFGYTAYDAQIPNNYVGFYITASNGYFCNLYVTNNWYKTGNSMKNYPITKTIGYTTPILMSGNGQEYEMENVRSGAVASIETSSSDVACFRLDKWFSDNLKRGDRIDVHRVEDGVTHHFVYDGCDNDWLAYSTECGGWDVVYFNAVQRTDANSFSSYTNTENGKIHFRNDITERYVAKIRIDKEGQDNLHHLINSPTVYFNGFGEDDRVLITNTEAQGSLNGKMRNVDITFERSKTRLRH